MARRLAPRVISITLSVLVLIPALLACALPASQGAADDEIARDEIGRVLQLLELGPGAVVADVGAGAGRQAVAIASRIGPDGRVIATEVEQRQVDSIRRRVEREGLENVEVVLGDQDGTGLGAGCCDGILVRRVVHHFTRPQAMFESLYAALKPGGRMVVIDFEPGSIGARRLPGVPENRGGHGMPTDLLVEELTAVGFEVIDRIEPWEGYHYCLVLNRLPR